MNQSRKYVLRNRDIQSNCLDCIASLDISAVKPYSVDITEYKSKRSLEQNALLHAWCADLAEYTGNSAAEMKEYLKEMFGPSKTVEILGKVKTFPKSTADYSTKEMAAFLDIVQMWAAEMGCFLEVRIVDEWNH